MQLKKPLFILSLCVLNMICAKSFATDVNNATEAQKVEDAKKLDVYKNNYPRIEPANLDKTTATPATAETKVEPAKTVSPKSGAAPLVGVVYPMKKDEAESVLKNKLNQYFNKGDKTGWVLLNEYKSSGEFDEEDTLEAVLDKRSQYDYLVIGYNRKYKKGDEEWLKKAQELTANKKIVVSGDQAQTGENASMLTRTLFGQLKPVMIVGDIKEKEILQDKSNFGPEMITALSVDRCAVSQPTLRGEASLCFAQRWVAQKDVRTTREWDVYFRDKKIRMRKMWLNLEDLF